MTQSRPSCPLKAAHKRLLDCHVHWHDMADHYMDPESFRLKFNALIQELRNVTFLLQKQKAQLQGFGEWYPEWQESAKADPVMKWSVDSRNRVVKEADLGLLSLAKARYTVDWNTDYERTFNILPRYSTRQIMNIVLRAIGPTTEGVVRVERVWVDCKLPDREILEATGHVLENLRKLILLAHETQCVTECDVAGRERDYDCVEGGMEGIRGGYMCLEFAYSNKILDLSLDDFSAYQSFGYVVKHNPEIVPELRARYGEPTLIHGDAIEALTGYNEMAKAILARDNSHMMSIFLYKGEKIVHSVGTVPYDQNGKYAFMNRVADAAVRYESDGIVLISETWLAPGFKTDTFTGRLLRSGEREDRFEALIVTAATADGRARSLITIFARDENQKVVFQDTIELEPEAGPSQVLAPVLRRWYESRKPE